MQEILERVAIRNHGSFLPHGAVYKVTRDILKVGDVWAPDLSKLEMQNAATKRVARGGGARNLTMRTEGKARAPLVSAIGPANLVATKGYSGSMSKSTLNKILGATYLRRGGGDFSTPPARNKTRLFGQHGPGRTKVVRTGTKLEKLGATYNPADDSCVAAFARLLAERA